MGDIHSTTEEIIIRIRSSLICLTVIALSMATPLELRAQQLESQTDSVVGTLVERIPDGFVLETERGEQMALEIVSDTVNQRQELHPDSVPTRSVPHESVMSRDDILLALRQLEASEERQRMHVHYMTPIDEPARKIVVWLSIAQNRVPGGP